MDLFFFSAGTNVIRMVPPLVITKSDVDEMIEKVKEVILICLQQLIEDYIWLHYSQ